MTVELKVVCPFISNVMSESKNRQAVTIAPKTFFDLNMK
jgi:hypothetical protein